MVALLGVLDFAHVESTDSAYLIMPMNLCWGLTLCHGQHSIDHVLPSLDRKHLLEIVEHHFAQ